MTTPRRQGQWRWVAHPPWRPPLPTPRPPLPRYRTGPAWGSRTPAYPATPRWGLPPVVIAQPGGPHAGHPGGPHAGHPGARSEARPRRLATVAPGIMRSAGAWFAATAVAHALRYATLAWYADRLTPWWLEAVTTAFVWVTGIVALAVGAAAAIAATAWLVDARRRAYAPVPDPRSRAGLWAGALVVVVNFFRLPVYLEELRRASNRAPSRSDLRRWWAAWGVNAAAVTLALWRRTGDGTQAAADAVLLTALAALAAWWAARETRAVMRSFTDPSPRFTRRFLPAGIVEASAIRKE